MRIDDFMPVWDFGELHQTRVQAPPERTWRAVRTVTVQEIRFLRLLMAIRSLGPSRLLGSCGLGTCQE